MRRKTILVLLLAATVVSSGCAALHRGGAATGGQTAFRNGALTVGYGKDIATTYEAAVKAMTDLGMTIRSTDKNENKASITATRPDDMAPITITLDSGRHGVTAATIKVGENGDESYSRVVAKGINARLNG